MIEKDIETKNLENGKIIFIDSSNFEEKEERFFKILSED